MRKTRVLHLIEALGPGGAERLLYTNLSRIDRSRFEHTVYHLYDTSSHWHEPIRQLGIPVISLQMAGFYDMRQGFARLLRLVSHRSVDLIHTHLYGANIYGRLLGKLKTIPVLSSLHNPDYESEVLQDNVRLTRVKLAFFRGIDRLSCQLSKARFLAVSEYVRRSAIRCLHVDPEHITVLYNSVDLRSFQPGPRQAVEGLRQDLALPPGAPVLLCVGRIDPQKGQKYLIQALAEVKREFPSTHLLLAGSGQRALEAMLMAEAQRCGVLEDIHFLGVRRDVPKLLQLCDVFVLPSLFEGLGIALIEAMAMERACVSSNVSAVPEVVAQGESGLLVPPRDPQALAHAILVLLRDESLRARMGQAGKRIVEERFNVDHYAPQLQEIYYMMLRANG